MKPILFNTEAVKALLDGRKAVTRQVVKPQPNERLTAGENALELLAAACAPYRSGDILYVRETWQYMGCISDDSTICDQIVYRASWDGEEPLAWRPSIHMPREAARIFLRVTNVRVERLQHITRDEAVKEGANPACAVIDFQKNIWDSTIKLADRALYGWDANPWVWVIEFERCKKPKEW